ncbi:MAG: hypothetical protein HQ582_06490, partial [Planctomycetes bacterium]|nr:hypothetical protein [Planctomycetota bacterium]
MIDRLQRYASSFSTFADDLVIPAAHGPARFADVMADFQRERFEALAPALMTVVAGRQPPIGRYWWEATKGASKDSDLAVAMLWALAFAKRPLTIQVAAGDRDQANELRKCAKEITGLNLWLGQAIEVQAWKIVNPRTGSECEIIAADVAGSHGARPDILIANELSHVAKREFIENLMDNLTKVPRGLGIVATNAGFDPSWQFKWREHARTSPDWAFHKYAKPAPWLSERQVKEARIRNSESRYRRLWGGEWVSPGGDAMPSDWIDRAIVRKGPLRERDYDLYQGAGLGVDLGLQGHHAAAVAVLSDDFNGKIRVAEVWDFKPPVVIDDVEAVIREAGERFGIRLIVADPWQFVGTAQRLEREGFTVILE